jgi:uncharacterized membrane protein YeaQ/YmgE (transglycosylase-associated protein family)
LVQLPVGGQERPLRARASAALVGGWLAGRIFNVHNPISGFNLTTLVVAFLGAVIVLLVFRFLKKR